MVQRLLTRLISLCRFRRKKLLLDRLSLDLPLVINLAAPYLVEHLRHRNPSHHNQSNLHQDYSLNLILQQIYNPLISLYSTSITKNQNPIKFPAFLETTSESNNIIFLLRLWQLSNLNQYYPLLILKVVYSPVPILGRKKKFK